MTAIRAQLEDAVLRELSVLKSDQSGGYLQTLDFYSGELSPGREDPDFQRVSQGAMPAILVTTGDGDYDEFVKAPGRRACLNFRLELLVASGNLRSGETRNRGDLVDPGIYQMIEDIRQRLFRRELGVAKVGWLLPIAETPVLRATDRTIWQISYDVETDASHPPTDNELGDFTSIHNEVNLPDGVGDDANPIAEFDNTLSTP
ncbi:hypothetical protein LCGC14_1928600 [marine sediment metagenome]|uniref:Uncharacterized protein n=1 Tax=marine sediment metagenome TaxID=412755 RepID=A0A0F9FP65_9ZZZZ